jgi:hypothetical protein
VVLVGYDSHGVRRFRHEMYEADVEIRDVVLEQLHDWLNRIDPPRPPLRLA